MATSQNGWPVVGSDSIVDKKVLGVEFPNGWLKGDVDTVFTYLIEQLHKRVEPIDNGGCWGYFVKHIEGSSSYSNHASGTAIDYNAPAHPMGKRNTYSVQDRNTIHDILKYLENVIRWGGDYTGRPDDMHFEVIGSRNDVKRIANKIRSQRKLVFMEFLVGLPILKEGDKDDDFDGYDRIKRIQRIAKVEDDGVWGPKTSQALGYRIMNEDRWRALYGLSVVN